MIINGIRMFEVESSAVKAIGYGDGSLLVHFNSGRVYEYKSVPAEEFIKLINADSIGKHINAYIKDYNYDYICDR